MLEVDVVRGVPVVTVPEEVDRLCEGLERVREVLA